MSFVINTNVMSLVAQQNLSESRSMLNQSIERLSSGRKINSAADDAAGLAIANGMTAQVNGLQQARANANDGISLAQTTEGALNQINDNLQRTRELTVQALNGTYTQENLESIQNEINQRLAEITRISNQASFNGIHVLDGSQSSVSIQVGAYDNQTINIQLQQIDAQTLGMKGFDVTTRMVLSDNFGGTQSDGATGVVAKFEVGALSNPTESGAGGTTTTTGDIYALKDGSGYVVLADDGKYYALDNGDASALTYDSTAGATDASQVDVAAGPAESITAQVTLDTATNLSGADITALTDDAGNVTGEYIINNGDGTYNMVTIDTGGAATLGNAVTVDPLASLDEALSQVGDLRSGLGAIQNRLHSAISNISTTVINLSAAKSRIVDADYAQAVSSMTKAQILQQAGTAVLAQANQANRGVLSLLR